MRLLKDELQNFARRKGLRRGIEAAAVINATNTVIQDVLPNILLSDVKVESFSDGLLKLRVPSGSAMTTANIYRQQLLEALKQRLGKAKVERIQILPSETVADY